MELGHVPSGKSMHVRCLKSSPIVTAAFLAAGLQHYSDDCVQSLAPMQCSIDFYLYLVSVRIANKDGEAFALGTVVHLCLGRIKPFTLERGDHIVNA